MAGFIQHLATPPTTFRFLDLPFEIRIEVVNHVSRPSDIKALCRVSKEIRDIATPHLYNRVDLAWKRLHRYEFYERFEPEATLLARISSLLSAPSNLRFIRILTIDLLDPETTEAIDALLPQLQENGLIEFDSVPRSKFPTSKQIRLLWSRQKNLQNIQLCTHHISVLIYFCKQTQEPPNCLPKSITRLELSNIRDLNSDVLLLPLDIIDTSRLRSFTLSGAISSKIVYQLNGLFASRSFFRLTDLHVEQAVFEEALELSNLPSLNLLSFGPRESSYQFKNKGLVVPEDFPLRKLVWTGDSPLDHPTLESVVPQIKGLEHLEIESNLGSDWTASKRKVLAELIMMHEATLKTLLVDVYMDTEDSAFDEQFLRQILRCKQLEKLALYLQSYKPVCCEVILAW